MTIQIPEPFSNPNAWAEILNDNWQEIKDRLTGVTETGIAKDEGDFGSLSAKNASVTNDFSHQWGAGTNVDASRSASTTYQNTTGKMLKVYIRTTADTTGTTSGFQAFVGPGTDPVTEGYEIAEGRVNDPTSGDQLTGSFEAPPDQYYELSTTSATIGRWNEKESTSQ